ncbi:hypothetical protein CORC01_14346 [Colletotrichum orchidophilum]|uniref:Uncharacterized protein n=1 Tax=Colletotrichum orchidophilum TaxID=1209926 RepID=A0A1G4AMP6_9PEZI|nr:uncharacterized protein CORC01_14346 [Colletotrichum orchidophilum]OHE90355.1 hypothetical protein CORC01_14346 [Colletotrichum orchidophilum]
MATEALGPAEYALAQQLFISHKMHMPAHPELVAESSQDLPCIKYNPDLEDSPGLPCFSIPEPIFASETDTQNPEADDILAKSIQVFIPEDIFKLSMEATIPLTRFSHAVSRLELPSLRSDPRHDQKALARAIAETKCFDFFRKPNTLPREPVDDSTDEGLSLPPSAVHFHNQLARGAEPDELDYTEEDLAHVAESIYVDFSRRDLEKLIDMEMGPTMERAEAMTPPLIALPLDDIDEVEFFIPDADVCEIHQFSDPASLLNEDLEQSRNNLAKAYDESDLPDVSSSDILGIPSDTPSFEIETPRRRDVAPVMEVPILPRSDESISRDEEEDAFRNILRDTVEFSLKNLPGASASSPISENESRFNEQFNLLLKDKADTMTLKLEQEQVKVIDAIARLQPPVLDFSTAAPDWQFPAKDAGIMFSWVRGQSKDQFTTPFWPRNRQEQKELRWIPFPSSLGLTNVKESVGDNKVLQNLLEGRRSTALPTSADYVGQRHTLKVLRSDYDDDELPLPCDEDDVLGSSQFRASLDPKEDIMELIRKRKQEQIGREDSGDQGSPSVGFKYRRTGQQSKAAKILGQGLLLSENESNAAGKLLANYMNLRRAKRTKSPIDPLFPTTKRMITNASEHPVGQASSKPITSQPRTQEKPVDAPVPAVKNLDGPSRIIISTALPRGIMSALQAKLPGIDLVDRDFSRHNTRVWSPGSTKTVERQSSLSYEADIIPSPVTGIILTTVLKVRQKPLPGSKTQLSQLRERVTKVAPLYEQLIVLVSQDNPTTEHIGPLRGADAESYASFVVFAFSLGNNNDNSNGDGYSVRVVYVAGGQQTLAQWTCALVSTHLKEASHDVQQIIMPEETEWEVFLRRAGFNMYAAQVTLAVVKGMHPVINGDGDSDGDDGREGGYYKDQTLVRFLRMSPSERANTLKGFLGSSGARQSLVDRISARLG